MPPAPTEAAESLADATAKGRRARSVAATALGAGMTRDWTMSGKASARARTAPHAATPPATRASAPPTRREAHHDSRPRRRPVGRPRSAARARNATGQHRVVLLVGWHVQVPAPLQDVTVAPLAAAEGSVMIPHAAPLEGGGKRLAVLIGDGHGRAR